MKFKDILQFVSRHGQVSYLVGGRAYDTMKDARAAVEAWKRMAKKGGAK